MKFILTGGTIDSYYDTDSCTALPFKESVVRNYLEKTVCACTEKSSFEQICMKDSRDINEMDRQNICRIIEESDESDFVVTHGTYTLFETARYVQSHINRKDVKVTVTGALIPLFGFAPTDAGFSLGASMMNSKLNAPGVYVCIKGQIYPASADVELHS